MFAPQGVPQLEGPSVCRRVGGWSGMEWGGVGWGGRTELDQPANWKVAKIWALHGQNMCGLEVL